MDVDGVTKFAVDAVTELLDAVARERGFEVKHGEWVDNNNGTFTCSVCGGRASKMNYCGHCGAKMDGGKEE